MVEGVTEFLPVSSTGHLILAGNLLSFTGEKANTFEIFIQLGAIIAVVWLYRERLFSMAMDLGNGGSRRLAASIIIAFLPAAIIGLLMHSWIKLYLFNTRTVAAALIAGGLIILIIERAANPVRELCSLTAKDDGIEPPSLRNDLYHRRESAAFSNGAKTPGVSKIESISLRTALGIGLAQVFSLFPGVSRSGATIMGGLVAGLDRKTATEFSFFLAIPTMFAATSYDLLKNLKYLSAGDIPVFAAGFVVAFISALLVIKAFLGFVAKHNFSTFAYYRIIFGILILLLLG